MSELDQLLQRRATERAAELAADEWRLRMRIDVLNAKVNKRDARIARLEGEDVGRDAGDASSAPTSLRQPKKRNS